MKNKDQGHPKVFELRPILVVSPSLAETLRACPLQAALSRISGVESFVLGNPKAWLGTAYHEVLERLWTSTEPNLSDEQLIEYLWSSAIDALRQKAIAHPHDCRFALPEKWPGYHLARACVEIRAKQALAEHPRLPGGGQSAYSATSEVREQQLSGMDGKLIGKPDLLIDNEIRDYKSGTIYQKTAAAKTVKEGYLRQLRLYGHLANENYGSCPRKGRLLPMQGAPVEIDLDPETCAAEAVDAVNLLNHYNSQLITVSDVRSLAEPSPEACRWCDFKIICAAFWETADVSWAEEISSGAVRGILNESPILIHNGRALSISLHIVGGTTATHDIAVAPLTVEIHDQVLRGQPGDEVRIVNLLVRGDGQLVPANMTLCCCGSDWPSFMLPRNTSDCR